MARTKKKRSRHGRDDRDDGKKDRGAEGAEGPPEEPAAVSKQRPKRNLGLRFASAGLFYGVAIASCS